MRILRTLLMFGVWLALAIPAAAQTNYILTVNPTNLQSVLTSHGLTVVKELVDGTNCVYLVTSASSDANEVEVEVEKDLAVVGFEPERSVTFPELSGLTTPSLTQSTGVIIDGLPGRTLISYFGSTVPSNYINQTAASVIRLNDARTATGLTGAGVVAVIDTGADLSHPALAGVLLPGYDFTRDAAGGNELADLDPVTAATLQQSTGVIIDSTQSVVMVNASTAAILSQSTGVIIDQMSNPALGEFGHGTMVAGVVHLIAPTAKIMPLKAFTADGNTTLANLVRAIYYAADHGANVISMSFSMSQPSPIIQSAIQYALGKNITVIAASGNDGLKTLVYPAAQGGVLGIASTTNDDQRSLFSNYGSGVTLFAAPGEGVITTFPGGLYAAAWGTSFSTPMVSGAASLVLQAKPTAKPGDVINGLSKTKQINNLGGNGRIDLYQSLPLLLK